MADNACGDRSTTLRDGWSRGRDWPLASRLALARRRRARGDRLARGRRRRGRRLGVGRSCAARDRAARVARPQPALVARRSRVATCASLAGARRPTRGRRRRQLACVLYLVGAGGRAAGGRCSCLPFLLDVASPTAEARRGAGARAVAARGGGARRSRGGDAAARLTAERRRGARRARRPRRAGPDRPRAARRGRAPHLDDRGAGRDRPADHARACPPRAQSGCSRSATPPATALTEMRRLLGVLREDAAHRADHAPAARPATSSTSCSTRPATAGARHAADRAAAAVAPLDPGVELTAYRDRPGGADQRPPARPGRRGRRRAAYGDDAAAAAGPRQRARARRRGGDRRPRAARACASARRRSAARCAPARRAGGGFLVEAALPTGVRTGRSEHPHRRRRRPGGGPGRLRARCSTPSPTSPSSAPPPTAPRRCASAREQRPDVVLMDVRMPVDGRHRGHPAARRRRRGAARAHPHHLRPRRVRLRRARRRAPAASCSRTSRAERLFDAVRVVAAGEALLAPRHPPADRRVRPAAPAAAGPPPDRAGAS